MALSHVQTSVKPPYPQLARSSSERAAFKTRLPELACSVSSSSGWRPNKCRGGEHRGKFVRVASRQCCSLRNGFLTDTGILCPRRCPSLSVSRALTKAARAMAGPYTTTAARLEEAAKQVVELYIGPNQVIGLGTGPGCEYAIQHLGRRLKEGKLWNIKAIPASAETAAAAAQAGIPLTTADEHIKVAVVLEDPDLVQEGTLSFIIGRRGAPGGWGDKSIIKEKALAAMAEQYILIADSSIFVEALQGGIPVIIRTEDWEDTAEEIDDLFLGDAEIWRRPTSGQAGPLGGDKPLVTEGGHHVLDVLFTEPIRDPEQVARDLQSVPGVVDHGLVVNTAYAVAVGREDGVKIRTSLFKEVFRENVPQ